MQVHYTLAIFMTNYKHLSASSFHRNSTKCIYLDLVSDCFFFIMCLRFFTDRGVPALIIRDNVSLFIFNETQSFVNSGDTNW